VSDEASSLAGSEFEREPVPQKALLGFKSFIGTLVWFVAAPLWMGLIREE
jgi:hypothetical protein